MLGLLTFTVSLDNAVAVPSTVDVTLADVNATRRCGPAGEPRGLRQRGGDQVNFAAGSPTETQQFTVATLDG